MSFAPAWIRTSPRSLSRRSPSSTCGAGRRPGHRRPARRAARHHGGSAPRGQDRCDRARRTPDRRPSRRRSSSSIWPVSRTRSASSDRDAQAVLELCAERGIAFVPFFPLGSAFTGGPAIAADPAVTRVAAKHGVSTSQVALAWLLHRDPHILLIPGTSSVGHLEENLGAATWRSTTRTWPRSSTCARPATRPARRTSSRSSGRTGRDGARRRRRAGDPNGRDQLLRSCT